MNQVAQTSSLPAYRWHNLLSHFSVVFDFCSHNNSKNWEDLPDGNYDVNRKPIWWQGFWKMMQNSGFQTLKMSWNVLNCPFRSWINHFLPQILQPGFSLEPGRVTQSTSIYLKSDISYKRVVPRLLSRWKIGWMGSLSTSTGSTSPGLGLSTGLKSLLRL